MENVGTLTKNGNPRHLSRVDYITFSDFNMQEHYCPVKVDK